MTGRGQCLPHFHIFAQHAWAWLAREHVAVLVDRAELRPAASRGGRIAALVKDEMLHPAVLRIADPDALLEAGGVDVVGFGIEHVDEVIVIDREGNAARHPELIPAREELAVLI